VIPLPADAAQITRPGQMLALDLDDDAMDTRMADRARNARAAMAGRV
jgi:hypothetical protein